MDTVSQIMNKLNQAGYTSDFGVVDKLMLDYDTGKKYSTTEVKLDYEYRTEGESSPDDSSILFAVTCNDGTKGTLVASYEATGNTDTIEFINQVDKTDAQDAKML